MGSDGQSDDAPAAERLTVRQATKRFGGVTVLDGVDLALRPGRVHALLGENGAGKSTLIKILSGVLQPDDGTVSLDGEPVELTTPAVALHHGIATLYQELAIVPGLSVAENIFLGRPLPTRAGLVHFAELDRRAAVLLERLGQHVDVGRDASRLSPVEMTMTAIARALSTDATVLILDEPTAALTDAETSRLFEVIRRLVADGVAVLYVSHRLEEVKAIADDYTMLRNGRVVAGGLVGEATIPELVRAMVGRAMDAMFPDRPASAGAPAAALAIRGLTGRRAIEVDLEVGRGEIVGIAGLAGSGRSELIRMIGGAQRPRHGTMTVGGQTYRPRSVAEAQAAGVGFVPQERRADGLVPDSIERNVNLTTLSRFTHGRVLIARRPARRHATGAADDIGVRRRSIDQPVLTLSGGNQQKVVLAKTLATHPTVLLLDEPTRGVDVGTKREIYHLIRRRADAGSAVIVVSSELPELLGLCDRILVMHDGRAVSWHDPASTTEHDLLLACYRTAA